MKKNGELKQQSKLNFLKIKGILLIEMAEKILKKTTTTKVKIVFPLPTRTSDTSKLHTLTRSTNYKTCLLINTEFLDRFERLLMGTTADTLPIDH